MEELYVEGLATRGGPESCAGVREDAGEALTGHMAYYAVPGNTRAISAFRRLVARHWFKVLGRRSQKARVTWERMGWIATRWLPEVRVMHPYPNVRFAAKT